MVKKLKNKKGFTLMEMLVVIAIIAILIAIAIPVYTAQMHKVKIATDWANVRAYYAEIQTAYMTEGEFLPDDEVPNGLDKPYDFYTLHFPRSNMDIKLETGNYLVYQVEGKGYQVIYHCNEHYDAADETLELPQSIDTK